jgi:hypothetical protein
MSLAPATVRAETTQASVSRETAFELLNSRRRRQVLRYLYEHDEGDGVELYDLTKQIAAWENDVTREAVTSTQRMRVYTALKQSHLPKMDDRGIVEYDDDRGTVRVTEDASDLEVYMDLVPHRPVRWWRYYLGLGVISAILTSMAMVEVYPFSMLTTSASAVLVCSVLVGSAIVHCTVTRSNYCGQQFDVDDE